MRDLKDTVKIENLCAKENGPVFVTKNGYSDLVIMSAELYDRLVRISRIDQAIFEAEKEIEKGGKTMDLKKAKKKLDKKYYG